jgi:hypothetical protein
MTESYIQSSHVLVLDGKRIFLERALVLKKEREIMKINAFYVRNYLLTATSMANISYINFQF